MGKDKDSGKDIVLPSTTRGGKNLPTRQQFSPNAVSAAPKVTPADLPRSSLSRSSISITEIESTEDEIAIEETGNLSKFLENAIDKVTENQSESGTTSPSSRTSSSPEDIALVKAFKEFDLSNPDSFDAIYNATLEEMLLTKGNEYEPAIFIKDEAYHFSIDPDVIKRVEETKFYGK